MPCVHDSYQTKIFFLLSWTGSVRVGALIYSTEVEIQFHLNQYRRKSDVLAAVDRIPYIYGSTNTADAMKSMRDEMFTFR